MRAATFWRWVLLVMTDLGAQIAFKLGGSAIDFEGGWWAGAVSAIHSPWPAIAFALYLATFFVWMTILRDDDLSRVFPMTAVTSVATALVGFTLFREPVTWLGLAGIACILVGVTAIASEVTGNS